MVALETICSAPHSGRGARSLTDPGLYPASLGIGGLYQR